MPALLDILSQQLTPDTVNQLSRQIGADPRQTERALAAALPTLIGALGRNARSPQGASGLNRALERDHDGSLLDNLGPLLGGAGGGGLLGAAAGALLGGGRSTNGASILGHLLGGKRSAVERGVGRAGGLSSAQTAQLLMMLAPIMMSALGRARRQQGLDERGLGELLNREGDELEQRSGAPYRGRLRPREQSGQRDMFDDDDDRTADSVAGLGEALLGQLFKR